jgi:DNA invertase Pin-like site-specific DNA recombinase
VKTAYDDGGFSGGNMDRPALQRLLADLSRGLVDVIVVYKIDRLTRSLADFARIVETLDRQGASFVSITQQFNTTTSMGRLTLNVLLSFAQFEREVTGERIRDKIAASKRRGMWMGGNLPLGYDVRNRELVVNEAEAVTVRHLFQRYAELGTVSALVHETRQRGIVSKLWTSGSGTARGGTAYSRGALHYLLRNPIYVGRIAHRGNSYAGQHQPIVPQELWDQVQAMLTSARQGQARANGSTEPSALSGLLYDDHGNRMSPSHVRKADGRRYRYYVSQALLQGRPASAGMVRRVSAHAIEALVERALGASPKDQAGHAHLKRLVKTVTIHTDCVEIVPNEAGRKLLPEATSAGSLRIATVMKAGRGGRRLVPSAPAARIDKALVKALAWARDLRRRLEHGKSLNDLAREDSCSRPYVSSLIRLAYLAPDVTRAIVNGTQPAQLTLADLMSRDIPLDWAEQRRSFGFF